MIQILSVGRTLLGVYTAFALFKLGFDSKRRVRAGAGLTQCADYVSGCAPAGAHFMACEQFRQVMALIYL